MTQKRASLISLTDTPFYHCVSRCVRRSLLCGVDAYSGQNYEHRRGWVEERLLFLSSVFAIDICAYAVMSNHVHLVLHVDVDKALAWSDKQVLALWHTLYKGTLLTQKYMRDEELSQGEQMTLDETIARYRSRLYDISWFMRNVNEYTRHSAPFSGLKLFLPESQSVQSIEVSGFASNIVLAKYQARQACRINSTAYLN